MRTHYKLLAQGYLLTLCAEGDESGQPLAEALQAVLGSEQRSVWVDCRYVAALPADALLLLQQSAAQLWQQGSHLVLCHLPAEARAHLTANLTQPLAASLLDGDLYGLDCDPYY